MLPTRPHEAPPPLTSSPALVPVNEAGHPDSARESGFFQIIFQKISSAWHSMGEFFGNLFGCMTGNVDRARQTVIAASPVDGDVIHNIREEQSASLREAAQREQEFNDAKDFIWVKINHDKTIPAGQVFTKNERVYAQTILDKYGKDESFSLLTTEQKEELITAQIICGEEQEASDRIEDYFDLQEKPAVAPPAPVSAASFVDEIFSDDRLFSDIRKAWAAVATVLTNDEPVPQEEIKPVPLSQHESETRAKKLVEKYLTQCTEGKAPNSWNESMEFYDPDCIDYATKRTDWLRSQHESDSDEYLWLSQLLTKHASYQVHVKQIQQKTETPESARQKPEKIDKQQLADIRDQLFFERNRRQEIFNGNLGQSVRDFYENPEKPLGETNNQSPLRYMNDSPASRSLDLRKLATGLKILAEREARSSGKNLMTEDTVELGLSAADRLAALQEVQYLRERMDYAHAKYPEFQKKISKFDSYAVSGVDSSIYLKDKNQDKFLWLLRYIFKVKERLDERLAELLQPLVVEVSHKIDELPSTPSLVKQDNPVPALIPAMTAPVAVASQNAADLSGEEHLEIASRMAAHKPDPTKGEASFKAWRRWRNDKAYVFEESQLSMGAAIAYANEMLGKFAGTDAAKVNAVKDWIDELTLLILNKETDQKDFDAACESATIVYEANKAATIIDLGGQLWPAATSPRKAGQYQAGATQRGTLGS